MKDESGKWKVESGEITDAVGAVMAMMPVVSLPIQYLQDGAVEAAGCFDFVGDAGGVERG